MRRRVGAFTLLEVMVAIMILAMAMVSISALQTSTITLNATVHRSTTASFLIHAVITELDLEYTKEGFPSNSIEGRDCEVPNELDDVFQCEYDLVRMDVTPDQIGELSMASMGNIFGDNMENMNQMTESLKNASSQGGMMDDQLSRVFMFAAPYFGPDGEFLSQMCPINWESIFTALMGTQMFLPQVVEFAAERVRKLKVTLSWREGFRGDRKLVIETFISSLPEEMIKAAEEAEELQNLQNQMMPGGLPPGGLPGASGGRYAPPPSQSGGRYGGGGRP